MQILDEFTVRIAQVLDHFYARPEQSSSLVHVINITIQDNHEDATIGAFLMCELAEQLEHCNDLDNEIDEVLTNYEERCSRTILHTVFWY